MPKISKYLLFGSFFFLSGCVTGGMGSEEVLRLQYGLAKVNKQSKEAVGKLEEKEIALAGRITALEETFQDLKNELVFHREALNKIQPGIFSSEDWTLPQEENNQLFQSAYDDYLKGEYSLSIMGFEEYLRINAKGSRAVEARYWMAESCFSQGDFESAIEAFDRLIKDYPENRWVSPALYKKAVALSKIEKNLEALAAAVNLIEKFPKSKESKLALELKKELETQIPKSQSR